MENALIFRLGGLGDLIVALPAMRFLRLAFPSAELILCCRRVYAALLLEAGVVDRVIPEESRDLLPLFAGEPAAARRTIKGFDFIIGWMQGEKPTALEQTIRAADLRAQILFIHAPAAGSEQVSRFFFDKTREGPVANPKLAGDGPLTAPVSFEECAGLPVSQKIIAEGLALWGDAKPRSNYAVIHPGSGGAAKRWPPERFMAIVERLARAGIRGALVTGEAEEEWETELSRFPLPPSWLRLRSPDLTSLAGVLAEASLYLGNDSGVTHLAAACGAPTVALFLEDRASSWRPYGRVHLHQARRLEEIALDSVWATVSGLFRL